MFFKKFGSMFSSKHANTTVQKQSQGNSDFENRYYTQSMVIESVKECHIVVAAIIRNDYLVYNNIYNSDDYDCDKDGDIKFRGPVFKIELSLRNCDNFSIFYGIVTNDRQLVMMDIEAYPGILDEYAVNILKEIQFKCKNLYNLMLFAQAPTRYTYHLYKGASYYYLTNNRGDDSYFIDCANGTYKRGSRGYIVEVMNSAKTV